MIVTSLASFVACSSIHKLGLHSSQPARESRATAVERAASAELFVVHWVFTNVCVCTACSVTAVEGTVCSAVCVSKIECWLATLLSSNPIIIICRRRSGIE